MATRLRSICVFCGSSAGTSSVYAERALALGRELGLSGRRLVYGGSDIGLMGILANAALEAGGEVIGVIPRKLYELVDQPELTELIVVADMHERKAKMTELSDAFIALPGGIGTLEEVFEAWTWRQLGYHAKPVGLLEVEGFFSLLLGFLEHTAEEGFLKRAHLEELVVAEEPRALLDALEVLPPPSTPKLPARHRS